MYVYLLLNIAAFALAFLFERRPYAEAKKEKQLLFDRSYFAFCGLLLLLSALRYGIAVDYDVYYLRYTNGYETGNPLTLFVWIFRLLRGLGFPYQTVIILCSAGFLIPVFYLIWKYIPEYRFSSLGILLGFMFYIQSYNIFRQFLAMGLFLYFVARYIATKKPLYLLLIVIPVLIHPILALALPVYAIALVWKPTRKSIRIIQIIAILIFFVVNNEMTEWIMRKVAALTLGNIPAYAHYANSTDTEFLNSIYKQSMEFIPKVLYFPCMLLLPEMIIAQQNRKKKHNRVRKEKAWWIPSDVDVPGYLVRVYFLYTVIMSFKLGSEITSRFLLFFSILGIFIVPIMFKQFFLVFQMPVFGHRIFQHPFLVRHPQWKVWLLRAFQIGVAAVCIYTQIRCIKQNACGAYPYSSIIDLLFTGA